MADADKYLAALTTTIPRMKKDLNKYRRLIKLLVELKHGTDDTTSTGDKRSVENEIKTVERQLQLPSTFCLYENKELCKGCPGCEEDTPPIVPNEIPQLQSTISAPKIPLSSMDFLFLVFTKTTTTPTSGFKFSTPAATSASITTTTTTTTTTNTSSTFSFGSKLVSANKPVFVFARQDPLIFGTNATIKTNTNENDEGNGEDDSYEPNVSFKPIVQLFAVEVKTGEEDENVLFCELAKLYPFDVESNQIQRT
ncbi:unnamed protein product [Rotaria magnacalcarata]